LKNLTFPELAGDVCDLCGRVPVTWPGTGFCETCFQETADLTHQAEAEMYDRMSPAERAQYDAARNMSGVALRAGRLLILRQAVQVQAMKELLDRGYGRATLPLSGDADGPPVGVHYVFEWAGATPQPTAEPDVEAGAAELAVTFDGETC
jgi:hypothetical protein